MQIIKVKNKAMENPEWLELNATNKQRDIQTFEEIRTIWSELLDEVRINYLSYSYV